jgi:hypothetical protein
VGHEVESVARNLLLGYMTPDELFEDCEVLQSFEEAQLLWPNIVEPSGSGYHRYGITPEGNLVVFTANHDSNYYFFNHAEEWDERESWKFKCHWRPGA